MDEARLQQKIVELKKKLGAVIVAHNYQRPEVQDIADFVGDSLELSRRCTEIEAEVIVFCGVHFMAETAAILNPHRTVLLSEERAGCPLADMIDAEVLKDWKQKYVHLQAEFENANKRWDKSRKNLKVQYSASVLKSFLPLYDSFKKAIDSSSQENEVLTQFYNQFLSILKFQGAEPIEIKNDDLFDYSIHEALTSLEREDVPENSIINVVQDGWKLGKDILRYSKVVISKKPKPPEPEPEPEPEKEEKEDLEPSKEEAKTEEKVKEDVSGIKENEKEPKPSELKDNNTENQDYYS